MRVAPVGAAFLACIVATGWTAVSLLLTPAFLLLAALVLAPSAPTAARDAVQRAYRRLARLVQWAWMGQVAMLLERAYGMEVEIYGDAAAEARGRALGAEPALWLANHRTRIDWMLLWSLALRCGALASLRIVLKAPLRALPIFGWAMQHFVFVFLQRRAAEDQHHVERLLPFLARAEPDASYLLFPEGTDLSAANVDKSAKFAAAHGLPARRYSLYPRTTGWTFMFPLLKRSVRAVYDLTLFYVDHAPGERPSELSLLSGRMPRAVHVYIERVAIEELAELDAPALAQWLEARFERKERLLADFYENERLPVGARPVLTASQTPAVVALAAFWLLLLALAARLALAAGLLWSALAGAAVCAGYAAFTAVGPGVDGFLVSHL